MTPAKAQDATSTGVRDTNQNKAEKIIIDWTQVETHVAPIDPAAFAYPFDKDSDPVKNYANAYGITNEQAQHSMMLIMAAPEALGKVIDQMQGAYLGHDLTDGKDVRLVIYTTNQVEASEHRYVFADKFAEGLSLPIVVRPKSADETPQVQVGR